MADVLTIIESMEDIEIIENYLKDYDIYPENIEIQQDDDLETLFLRCCEVLAGYNHPSQFINSVWGSLMQHCMIASLYTLRYLNSKNIYIKAADYISNGNGSYEESKSGEYTTLHCLKNDKPIREVAEKINRHFRQTEDYGLHFLYNMEELSIGRGKAPYIQNFLPVLSNVAECKTYSSLYTKPLSLKKTARKEYNRTFKKMLDQLVTDYLDIMNRCEREAVDDVELLLYFYKLENIYRIHLLDQAYDDLFHSQITVNQFKQISKLPCVFLQDEFIWHCRSSKKRFEKEISYWNDTLLPLYEKLFFLILMKQQSDTMKADALLTKYAQTHIGPDTETNDPNFINRWFSTSSLKQHFEPYRPNWKFSYKKKYITKEDYPIIDELLNVFDSLYNNQQRWENNHITKDNNAIYNESILALFLRHNYELNPYPTVNGETLLSNPDIINQNIKRESNPFKIINKTDYIKLEKAYHQYLNSTGNHTWVNEELSSQFAKHLNAIKKCIVFLIESSDTQEAPSSELIDEMFCVFEYNSKKNIFLSIPTFISMPIEEQRTTLYGQCSQFLNFIHDTDHFLLP